MHVRIQLNGNLLQLKTYSGLLVVPVNRNCNYDDSQSILIGKHLLECLTKLFTVKVNGLEVNKLNGSSLHVWQF